MKISLAWLREFVELSETPEQLRAVLDDLGLVVESIEYVGQGLHDVVVARVEEIHAIKGADRIRLVVVDAGAERLEIVCGATNFVVGNFVPLARVGTVLPGGFEIAQRKMRGVTSNGMLCSSRELQLSDDHDGLMILDDVANVRVGEPLVRALEIDEDVIFDISVEGNRPDAWCVEGVARDLATRLGRSLRAPALAASTSQTATNSLASAGIDAPDLCGRLTVSYLRSVRVGPSPGWMARRLERAGMRPISNVVDASNLVMLELGQPTHPYDAARVAGATLRARRARSGETLTTLDGVERALATKSRGLGDTGVDCVIVDGNDNVLGLAGVMGGASSEISNETSEVLLEAAFFDPMTIARTSKRHGLRSEASTRFERGVDPGLALRAVARYVELLKESAPDVEWLASPLDVVGEIPSTPVVTLRRFDIERLLGLAVADQDVTSILKGLEFGVERSSDGFVVTVPSRRLDVRHAACGRADVIEEIARLYGYQRLDRRRPSWPDAGALSDRQRLRRKLRDVLVDCGAYDVWTPSLVSDGDVELVGHETQRVRVTNPLSMDESVLRTTMLPGLIRAWLKNVERGLGDVILSELGVVFAHPSALDVVRQSKGGLGGANAVALPSESERVTVLLGRAGDDATSAVALWGMLHERMGLSDVVVRASEDVPAGLHPTRTAVLVDRASCAVVGYLGEVDPQLLSEMTSTPLDQRVGVLDIDVDVLANHELVRRRPNEVRVPSRFPSAIVDLAFVTPRSVNAADLAYVLATSVDLVESVTLFDVYEGEGLDPRTRSLTYRVRCGARDRTLNERDVLECRSALIGAAATNGAELR